MQQICFFHKYIKAAYFSVVNPQVASLYIAKNILQRIKEKGDLDYCFSSSKKLVYGLRFSSQQAFFFFPCVLYLMNSLYSFFNV